MDYRVTHACGHQQNHCFAGYASQRERKLRWLESTSCSSCFVAGRQAEQVVAIAQAEAALAHLALTPLIGSERQIAWATAIRATRLAAIASAADGGVAPTADSTWYQIDEAKWWIDHRSCSDHQLVAKGARHCVDRNQTAGAPEG